MLTETASAQVATLSPADGLSRLFATDPEYAEIFSNFAFDDVAEHVSLPAPLRMEVLLAVLLGAQCLTVFRDTVRTALSAGVSAVQVKEIIYHASSYLGMARVADFINAANDIFTEQHIPLPLPAQGVTTRENRLEKGLALKKGIFKVLITRAHNATPADQMHFQNLLTGLCCGDLYTRSGLTLKERQLMTFAVLIGMGDCVKQLREHIEGNFNLGNDRAVLLGALTQCVPYIGFPRAFNTLRCINEVQAELKNREQDSGRA